MSLEVGQTVYVKPINSRSRKESVIVEAMVSKVGKKYFELESYSRSRFFIDTLFEDGGQYMSGYKVYLSMEEIENERLLASTYELISSYFKDFGGKKLPLEKLLKIKQIIEAE